MSYESERPDYLHISMIAAICFVGLVALAALFGGYYLGITAPISAAGASPVPPDAPEWNGKTRLQPDSFFFPEPDYIGPQVQQGNTTVFRFVTAMPMRSSVSIANGSMTITLVDDSLTFMPPPVNGRCCGSMYPTISDRSGLLTVVPEEDEIEVGDMIVFACANKSLLHRVTQIIETEDGTFYRTQGDNNRVDDEIGFGCLPQYANISQKVVGVLY